MTRQAGVIIANVGGYAAALFDAAVPRW